jgi:hypothetical protein
MPYIFLLENGDRIDGERVSIDLRKNRPWEKASILTVSGWKEFTRKEIAEVQIRASIKDIRAILQDIKSRPPFSRLK